MANSSPDLIPLRALNQVTYCPRLYYLEYVDSLMQSNEFVEDGSFQHRRVHDEQLAGRTRRDHDAETTRSIMLGSERLGLVGKLDILETRSDQAVPVEYKRGSGPREGAWENDAVQLCAQGMLLEEALGRPVQHGILYYQAAKRRVLVPFDAPLREKTLQAIQLIQQLQQRDTPPEPLPDELRHRCHGCSLAPVCLPEETLFLIRQQANPPDPAPAPGLTRVLPQSAEGAVLYLQEPGSYVNKRGQHLVVHKDGAEINRIPLAPIRQVVVFGNVQLTTPALTCLASNDIPVVYLTSHGRFVAALQPALRRNVQLRVQQYRAFADPAQAFALSRAVVKAKVANQRTLLLRWLRPRQLPGTSPEPVFQALADLLLRIDTASDPAVLLGIEGQAAHLYFAQFPRILKSDSAAFPFDFHQRRRRPPPDPVNALLSFAYALLAKDCFSAVATVGFDPYLGFFHASRHGKPALALDLMEEFRPIIADSVVVSLINKRLLTSNDFLIWRNSCQLTPDGRKKFFHAYEHRLAEMVTHPLFGYKMSYARMLEVQARLLAACIRGDLPSYTGFTVR